MECSVCEGFCLVAELYKHYEKCPNCHGAGFLGPAKWHIRKGNVTKNFNNRAAAFAWGDKQGAPYFWWATPKEL